MAPIQQSTATRLYNDAVCEALYLIDANLGAWPKKPEQDAAFEWLLNQRPIERLDSDNLTESSLHTAYTLRTLMVRTVGTHQKGNGSRGRKGINDVFALGSAIFPQLFLREIGLDNTKDTNLYSQAQQELDKSTPSNQKAKNAKGKKANPTAIQHDRTGSPDSDVQKPMLSVGSPSGSASARLEGVSGNGPSKKRPREEGKPAILTGRDDVPAPEYESLLLQESDQPQRKRMKTGVLDLGVAAEPPKQGGQVKGGKKRRRLENGNDEDDDEDSDYGASQSKARPKKKLLTAHFEPPEVNTVKSAEKSMPARTEVVENTGLVKERELNSDSRPDAPEQPDHAAQMEKRATAVADKQIVRSDNSINSQFASGSTKPPVPPIVEADAEDENDLFYTAGQAGSSHNPWVPNPLIYKDTAKVPRTKKPQSIGDLNPRPAAGIVEKAMAAVHSSAEQAARSYCLSRGFDLDDDAQFLPHPSQDLEELYKTFFADDEWRDRYLELRERENRPKIMAEDAIVGLIAAAVLRWVFLKTLPWDPESRFNKAMDTDEKYFHSSFLDRGYEHDFYIKHVLFKQIIDKEFRDSTVAPYARSLADALAMTLEPHLERLTEGRRRGGRDRRDWRETLQNAFTDAIVAKQRIAAAAPADATFEYFWPKNDEPFSRPIMTAAHDLEDPGDTIVTLMPGVRMTVKRDDGDKIHPAAKAVVLSLKPGESQKDPVTREIYRAGLADYE